MARVVFVMVDGLRPDAISPDRTPNIQRLISGGASTLTAQSVTPSITLPCHTSIFHSVPPSRHGITSNVFTPFARPIPGLIEAAEDGDKTCAFIYNWEELRDLNRPGSLHYSQFFRNGYDLDDGDRVLVDAALPLITAGAFDFMFLYLGTIDTSGHMYGWMSAGYLEQVRRLDVQVGRLLADLPADTTMLLQADHGGHDRTHGTDSAEDMTIPWILVGAGVRAGYTIERPVSLIDTAPTLAHALGIKTLPIDWEGTAVTEAFG